MNDSRGPLFAGAAACLVAGLAIGYALWGAGGEVTPADTIAVESGAVPAGGHQHGAGGGSPPASEGDEGGDVIVTLTPEMTARAGIKTISASAGAVATTLRLPGVVQPNAYREVAVTSLVSGRVTQVTAELGARVMAQDPLATIYSPELAEAQFSQGKLPYFETVRRYLLAEHEAGSLQVDDAELAATQFLGMISNHVFWPTLLVPGWQVDDGRVAEVVDEAVRTAVARYARRPGAPVSR